MKLSFGVSAFACFAAPLFLANPADAALLVYDNFDGNASASLIGQTTTGLGLTGTYTQTGTVAGQTFTVTNGGLAFSDLNPSSGKSVVATSVGSGSSCVVQLGAVGTVVGTLYSSYLVNLSALSAAGTALAEARIASSAASAGSAARFRLMADSPTSSNTALSGIGYDSTQTTGGSLAANTTYLMIGRFTNVGVSIGIGGGQASLFALSEAQYSSFIAAGGTDTYLDAAAIGTGVSEVTAKASDTNGTAGTFSFTTGNFQQTAILAQSGSAQTFTYDAVRFGDSLSDVTVIPEPAVALVAALGSLTLLQRRRKYIGK